MERECQLNEEKRLINEHADKLKESLQVQNILSLQGFDNLRKPISKMATNSILQMFDSLHNDELIDLI